MALVHSGKYTTGPFAWSRRVAWLIDWIRGWHRAAADRRYLAGLNDHDLKDLGLSRHDVEQGAPPRDRFW